MPRCPGVARTVRACVAVGAFAALVAVAPRAAAGDKEDCVAAFDRAEDLRTHGKLLESKVELARCTASVCPALLREDCSAHIGQVMASVPTIVLRVRDAHDQDRGDVNVLLDGKPLGQKLDGKAFPIDPGEHSLRFELAGSAPVAQSLIVLEGEKNRIVAVRLDAAPAPPHPPPARPAATPETAEPSGHSVWPWITAAAGGAAVVTGAVVLAVGKAAESSAVSHCTNDTASSCMPAAGFSVASIRASYNNANGEAAAGGVVMGAGALVLIGGLVWHFVEPSSRPAAAALAVTPVLSPGVMGAAVTARF